MKFSLVAILGTLAPVSWSQEITDTSITPPSTMSQASLATATAGPSDSSSSPTASSPSASGGVCGYGYTYCGWMLISHNGIIPLYDMIAIMRTLLTPPAGFSDSEVKQAFCDGKGGCNDADHQGNTTYLSGLFVCRPDGPSKSAPPPTFMLDQAPAPKFRFGKRAMPVTEGAMAESSPAPTACSDSSSSSSNGPHKLTLLCACGGSSDPEESCLNPPDDNIGRCATPCKN